jgi:hypothetical protein
VALTLVVLLGGATWAARTGSAVRPAAAGGQARSATWICPHGGGERWTGTVAVAAAGAEDVHARVRSLGAGGSVVAGSFSVPAGTQVLHPVEAGERGSATVVDVFGGWAGVGWQVRADGDDHGLGVEPCTPVAGQTWYTAGLPTGVGERAFLTVTNPFAAVAIVDVTIYAPDAPPVRDPDLTDLTVPAGSSVSVPVTPVVPGKAATAVSVTASTGRVAVGALTVDRAGGVGSTLGSTSLGTSWILPSGWGAGQATLTVGVLGEEAVRLDAPMRSQEGLEAGAGLIDARQPALSAAAYPFLTTDVASVELRAAEPVVAALRAVGEGADQAATAGVGAPASDWLVVPTVQEEPRTPGVVLVNAGTEEVQAQVSLVGATGASAEPVTITVAAGQTGRVPPSFLGADPTASVLVRADGPLAALGASTSSGRQGIALYAFAIGIPVPAWAFEPGAG